MIIDAKIFKYIVKDCKKLRVLTMSGWLDGTEKPNMNNNAKKKSSELAERRNCLTKPNGKSVV